MSAPPLPALTKVLLASQLYGDLPAGPSHPLQANLLSTVLQLKQSVLGPFDAAKHAVQLKKGEVVLDDAATLEVAGVKEGDSLLLIVNDVEAIVRERCSHVKVEIVQKLLVRMKANPDRFDVSSIREVQRQAAVHPAVSTLISPDGTPINAIEKEGEQLVIHEIKTVDGSVELRSEWMLEVREASEEYVSAKEQEKKQREEDIAESQSQIEVKIPADRAQAEERKKSLISAVNERMKVEQEGWSAAKLRKQPEMVEIGVLIYNGEKAAQQLEEQKEKLEKLQKSEVPFLDPAHFTSFTQETMLPLEVKHHLIGGKVYVVMSQPAQAAQTHTLRTPH